MSYTEGMVLLAVPAVVMLRVLHQPTVFLRILSRGVTINVVGVPKSRYV